MASTRDAAMAGFPASRLKRFFDKLDGSYQVSKELSDDSSDPLMHSR